MCEQLQVQGNPNQEDTLSKEHVHKQLARHKTNTHVHTTAHKHILKNATIITRPIQEHTLTYMCK